LTTSSTGPGVVLRHLRDAGPRSRARIAPDTGLNKATVSSLVAELVERGLVGVGAADRAGAVGRPGPTVDLDGRAVCGIGVELDVGHVAVLVLDLRGEVLLEHRVPVDVAACGSERALDEVAALVRTAVAAAAATGAVPVGATVAVPGLVDDDGVVPVAPNIGWRGVAVRAGLRARLPDLPLPAVENDANLAAIAECVLGPEARTPDLVRLTGGVGVGSGVIVAGRLLRGSSGLSGEVGHFPSGGHDRPCGCGRRGCWEAVVGLGALLRAAADGDRDPLRDPGRDPGDRLDELVARAAAGDPRTVRALTDVGTALGTGAAIMINLLNPRVLVLGGYFADVGPFLLEPFTRELHARVLAPDLAGGRVALSGLGVTAAARGGALVALEPVFDDPTVVPVAPRRTVGVR
jgi:predicted NBD/HSP70 family sugar kinase